MLSGSLNFQNFLGEHAPRSHSIIVVTVHNQRSESPPPPPNPLPSSIIDTMLGTGCSMYNHNIIMINITIVAVNNLCNVLLIRLDVTTVSPLGASSGVQMSTNHGFLSLSL